MRNITFQENVPCYCKFYDSVYYCGSYIKTEKCFAKRQPESRLRQLGKTVLVKTGAYIVSIDRKTTLYRLKACEIAFLKMPTKLFIAMCSHISLTCL